MDNEPDPLNISTEDDQDLGLDLSDDEESDKLANEKRRSFDQDKKVHICIEKCSEMQTE